MTDKQIIIDGIDVTGCEYCSRYADTTIYNCDWIGECKEHPNCHYKQYQRELMLKKEIEEKLLRKEQECEELRKNYFTVIQQRNKAEKILTEIKEIAENAVNFCKGCGGEDYECIDCTNGGRAQISKEILQKISEVLE